MNINRNWLPWMFLGLGIFVLGFMLGTRAPTPRAFALHMGEMQGVVGSVDRFHWHDRGVEERVVPNSGVPVPQEQRFFHKHVRSGPACDFPLGAILPGVALIALGVWLLRRRTDDAGIQDPPRDIDR